MFAGGPILRVHFLMFGSYRINEKKDYASRLSLEFGKKWEVNFYSCAVRELEQDLNKYDWAVDPMSDKWDEKKVVSLMETKPDDYLCDILLDQNLFAGVGNIIKNEVLFRLKLHPLIKVKMLKPAEQKKLVKETKTYCFQFLNWKRVYELKKNWKLYRKRKCPECGSKPLFAKTGKLDRVSFICPLCQPAPKGAPKLKPLGGAKSKTKKQLKTLKA